MYRPLILLFLCVQIFAQNQKIVQAKLGNGLRIMVLPYHRVPQAWVQVWYLVGSKDEIDGHTGLAHILEHSMFLGTNKYPNFMQKIDAVGGYNNATTSQDYTNYFAVVPNYAVEAILKLEADRMHNLRFRQTKVTKELLAVREERLMRVENKPALLAREQANAILHIRGPYHHLPIGWLSDIENTKLNDLQTWYENWYQPNNALVVVAGDVEPNNIIKLVNKHFSNIPAKVLPKRNVRLDVPLRGNTNLTIKSKSFAKDTLTQEFLVPSLISAKDVAEPYALMLAAAILSYGNNSLLNEKLVNPGKALAVGVFYDFIRQHQTEFVLYVDIAKGKESPKFELRKILHDLANGKFSEERLARAKAQLISENIYSKDDFEKSVFDFANYALLGLDINDKLNFAAKVKAIKKSDVQKVVKKYLQQNYIQLNLIGV